MGLSVLLVPFVFPPLLAGCDRDGSTSPATASKPGVVLISGDTGGWITPCGCTSNQSGGLLRRASLLAMLRQSSDVLYLDAGGAAAGISPYFRDKFRAVLAGEKLMGVAAHNLGKPELDLGVQELRAASGQAILISANTRDKVANQPLASPLAIQEIAGRRVAVVGVVSPRYATSEIAVEEPLPAITRALGDARGKYDSVVVLAYLPDDELPKLAAALPEADAVIGGPTGQAISPRNVGPALLASATNKGKFVVSLDVPPAAGTRWTGRVLELGPTYPDDPAQAENLQGLLKHLAERDYPATDTGLVKTIDNAPLNYRVAGTASCIACHQVDAGHHASTKHAHALESLVARGGFEADPTCLQCHTTSYGLPGGFSSPRRTPQLVGVGCETCHGPSTSHVMRPQVRTPFNAFDQCVRCHDHENSPAFDRDSYWSRIKHGAKVSAPTAGGEQ